MAKTIKEIQSLARNHTETCLATLAGIMRAPDAPHSARVAAAQALLDRGWGKPAQSTEVTVKRVNARELGDDELALIAVGSSEGTAEPPIDPSQLN
jgi:hypothetical protein